MLADRDGASGNSCDVCGKNFSSKLKFAAHVKEHEKQEGIDDDEGGEGGGEMEKEEKGEKKGEEKKGEKEEEEKEEASGSGRGEEEEDERVPRSMTSRRTRSRKGKGIFYRIQPHLREESDTWRQLFILSNSSSNRSRSNSGRTIVA